MVASVIKTKIGKQTANSVTAVAFRRVLARFDRLGRHENSLGIVKVSYAARKLQQASPTERIAVETYVSSLLHAGQKNRVHKRKRTGCSGCKPGCDRVGF